MEDDLGRTRRFSGRGQAPPVESIVDEGLAKSLTTTTAKKDVYDFFFDQKGLMADLGLQGSKITRITPDKE